MRNYPRRVTIQLLLLVAFVVLIVSAFRLSAGNAESTGRKSALTGGGVDISAGKRLEDSQLFVEPKAGNQPKRFSSSRTQGPVASGQNKSIKPSSATTCPTGALTLYLVAAFTCTSGSLTFSAWGYSSAASPAGIAIPASAVTVTPITTTGNEGFQFAGGWNVGTQAGNVSSFQDSLITYTVTDSNARLADLHLFFNGSFTGTGLSGVSENYCLNHILAGCPAGSLGQVNVTNPPPIFNSVVNFLPVQSVSVSKDINATSGTNGTASISQVINTFSQIPPCPADIYTSYLVANFQCFINNLTFSAFGYSGAASPAGVAIPASAIFVTPITTTGNEGFQFNGGWNVGTQAGNVSSFQDSVISYTVTAPSPAITDMHLFFNGSFTGTGLTGVSENYCLNNPLAGCPAGNGGQINVTNPPPSFNSTVFFAPVTSVSVSNDINATSGTNGTANISQVIATYSSVTQPTVAKAFNPTTIALNGTSTLTFTIQNLNGGGGPAIPLTNVSFTDNLPSGLLVASPNNASTTCGGGTVTAVAGSKRIKLSGAALAANASCTVTVDVTGTTSGLKNNPTSRFTTNEFGNSSFAGQTLTVNQSTNGSDLTLVKSHFVPFVKGQSGAVYIIAVSNSGNAATSGTVTVSDTLPAGLTPTNAVGTGWSCLIAAQTVTCTRSNALAAGASYPGITVVANVDIAAANSLTNTATVSGGGEAGAPALANDSASDQTPTINSGTNCPNGALTLYLVPNFTCQTNNEVYSGFRYSASASPSGIAIPAANVTVTPITTNGNEGFQFAGGWNVGTQTGNVSSFQDSLISFNVSTADESPTITGEHLFFNGSFTGTGLSGATENFCLFSDQTKCGGGSIGQISTTNPPPNFNSVVVFSGVPFVAISKDINVTSGINGTASTSQVINTFSDPAPSFSVPTAANGVVSGRILDGSGNPVEGVVISLTGTQNRKTITDANGDYNFDNVETTGAYRLVPSRANFAFSPSQRSFSQFGQHTEATFVATTTGNRLNPMDTTEYFVRQQYLDFLDREPEEKGFNDWTDTINNCPAGDTSCDRIHISEMFFRSQEFQQRGYFVYRFYSTAFGRKPDYGEFKSDFARVSGFLTDDQLEAAKVGFVNEFMARPSFAAQYNSLNNSAYVDALINTAGVNISNRQTLIDGLEHGTLTRAQALRQIAESGEVYQKYYNHAFVVMEYFGYLRRDPDALFLNWIQVLDADPTDSRHMVEGFVNSTEYRNRFVK